MQGNTIGAGVGEISAVVWPTFVGFCTEDPGVPPIAYGEPTDPAYRRGQIFWQTEVLDGIEQIVGRAFVMLPKTSRLKPYTHQAFFSGPEGNCMLGKCQLSQPLPVDIDVARIECYPIVNPDMQLNKSQGIDY